MPDKNVQWTTDYNIELPIRMSKTGPGKLLLHLQKKKF